MAAMKAKSLTVAAVAAAAVTFLLPAGKAGACDTPVFRYALERWQPGCYEVLVFHRGDLPAERKKLADSLAARAADRQAPCNVEVRMVDVAGKMEQDANELWKTMPDAELPRVVACFPRRYGPLLPAWTGKLEESALKTLADSPVRQEVAKRICAGDSAVWVFLEGGDKAKDDAAAKLLDEELKRLAGEIKLPVPEAPPWGAEEDAPAPRALKVAFSIVRTSRTAAAERPFIEMLLSTEPDLRDKKYAGEPMAFAIFGQGRSLFALVGKGIYRDNIEEVCYFLTGRCSCEVKDMNPGVDLLMAADWESALEAGAEVTAPLPAALGAPGAMSAEGADANAGRAVPPDGGPNMELQAASGPAPRQDGGGALVRNLLIAAAAIGLAALALVIYVRRKGPKELT